MHKVFWSIWQVAWGWNDRRAVGNEYREWSQTGRQRWTDSNLWNRCTCAHQITSLSEYLERVGIIVLFLLKELRLPRFKQLAQVTQLTRGKSRNQILIQGTVSLSGVLNDPSVQHLSSAEAGMSSVECVHVSVNFISSFLEKPGIETV